MRTPKDSTEMQLARDLSDSTLSGWFGRANAERPLLLIAQVEPRGDLYRKTSRTRQSGVHIA
jgi:hypothetical protein